MDCIAVSPCSNPELSLEEVLAAYSGIGFTQFEAFTSWVKSALDWTADAQMYRRIAESHGIRITSMHLPPITEDADAALEHAIAAARFAEQLGVEVVLFKAASRPLYIRTARAFLDATEELNITPVLQNHAGSPIATLGDYREVIEGIGDSRMKTLLEVGHFHSVGVSWRQGYELLGDSIALVHIKDQLGSQSVPFGTGEIDLEGLFAHLKQEGYRGKFVVEMEVADKINTLEYLESALRYLKPWL
ncbi:sugar phosphate isomerase/epimerase family protein [Paenibacillus thalictri]|uniref:Sugar phosphate isomerase/epimerase n=1 Tax=Paenibacillus thalictri TaxID=2527873 RepID=A0A4Q9DLR7_9BACL|nr:sugar phosphate isomerase/epimerase family protein [Paenibacillus thalictri]TBL73885.1 sugar phosphate isomerase/epimerase [Paenibacillus thalictri]